MSNNETLKFVLLAPFLRLMGQPPAWAIMEGYNLNIHDQVAAFGSKEALSRWRDENGLDPQRYPIQPSEMGDHIDIYGSHAIALLVPEETIIDTTTFIRILRGRT